MMWPRRSGSGLRTVEVASPSRVDEGGWVLFVFSDTLPSMIYTYGFERGGGVGDPTKSSSTHQRLSSEGVNSRCSHTQPSQGAASV